MARSPMDRSAAFTVLLEQDPDGFGKQDMQTSGQTITKFLEGFHASGETDMWKYGQRWLGEQRGDAPGQGRLPEAAGRKQLGDLDDPRPLERLWDVDLEPHGQEIGQ